jgi:hypothetical protein
MLPPSVICAFLAQQRRASSSGGSGSDADDDCGRAGGGGAARRLRGKRSGELGDAKRAARGPRRGGGLRGALSRLVRRTFITAAAAGLVAGGAAVGRLLHANYMATLDDRDALVRWGEGVARRGGLSGGCLAPLDAARPAASWVQLLAAAWVQQSC